MRLKERIRIANLVFLFIACVPTWPQNSLTRPCGARDLEISIASEPQSADERPGHLLVIDFRNRDIHECQLANMELKVAGGGNDYAWESPPPDRSPATLVMRQRSNALPPGDEAHILVAWSSVPSEYSGRIIANCVIRESLTVQPYGPPQPWLKVRDPAMRACDTMYHSGLRAGPYQPGEPIAQQWLDRQRLRVADFADEFLPKAPGNEASLRSFSNVEYLPSTFESGYSGYFELFMKVSSPASSRCSYRMLREREDDGETTIYLDPCRPTAHEAKRDSLASELRLRDLGMLPARAGRVEYEVTSEVLHHGRRANAQASYELSVRDPAAPQIPDIDSNLAGCRPEQLKFSAPVALGRNWDHPKIYAPHGETLNDAKVYQAANISSDTCLLGGVPKLKFLEPPEVTSGSLLPPVCRNCATPVFQPRDISWIELAPGSSAHFMVGRQVLDPTFANLCTVMGGIELTLPGDPHAIKLPFDAAFCGQVPVSAWREGDYDNDAMNVKYDQQQQLRERQRLATAPPLPMKCAKEVSEDTGTPTMFPTTGTITWGISARKVKNTEPALALLWLYNSSETPANVMTCMNIDFFWARSVDIFEVGGHRVLRRREHEMRTNPQTLDVWSCTRNFAITIPPHSCMHGNFSNPAYDFSRDLRTYYDLPAGRYFLTPTAKDKNNKPLQRIAPDQTNAVELLIEEP